MEKRAFLMNSAQKFELQDVHPGYDEKEQMSMTVCGDKRIPLVLQEAFGQTESKTMQAPGDDDPDPEDEGCY